MYRRWPLAALAVALALMTAPTAFGASNDPPRSAGWHGREIRDPLPQRIRDAARVPARLVGRQRQSRQRLRQPERLAPRPRSAAPVGAPRLPAGSGRRPLRRAHPRRCDLVSDQARVAAHGSGRCPQRRDPARDPQRAPHARDRGCTDPAQRRAAGSGSTRHGTAGDVRADGRSGAAGDPDRDRPRRDPLAWRMRAELRASAARRREHRAQLTAVTPPPPDGLVGVIGYVAVARGADRTPSRHRRTDHRVLVRGPRLAADASGARRRAGERPHRRPARARPMRSTGSPPGRVAGLVVARLGDLTELGHRARRASAVAQPG